MKENFEYGGETLRKLQITELEMLVELERICSKHGIIYVIDAGTLLGAVRHGGFIPWDDDIDIRMFRSEYDRFCEICKTELDTERFFLQTYETDPGYRWGYARILKNHTVFDRKDHGMLKSRNGIFIDVFPVDPYPEKGVSRWWAKRISWIARKGLYSEVGKSVAKSWWNRLGFKFLNLFSKRSYTRIFEYLTRKYKDYDTSLVRIYPWSEPAEEIGFKKEWFFETSRIDFEGINVSAPKDIHGFLVHSFGEDYMTLPPEEERFPRHPATFVRF